MRETFMHRSSKKRVGRDRWFSGIIFILLSLILAACAGTSTVTKVPPPTTSIPPGTNASSTAAIPSSAALSPTAPSIPLGTVTLTPEGSFEGYHERTTCMVIGGWAYDTSKPDTPINVEIFDGSALLTTVAADMFRADLRDAGKGNGNHSFSFTPPTSLKDGKMHQILIRIAGANIGLRGTPMPLTCTS